MAVNDLADLSEEEFGSRRVPWLLGAPGCISILIKKLELLQLNLQILHLLVA